jgi:hypothetical protein
VLATYSALHGSQGHTGANHATLVACSDRTDVVSVWRDDPTPCDIHKPQRLDVYGFTMPECDDAGGEYVQTALLVPTPSTYICEGVDY